MQTGETKDNKTKEEGPDFGCSSPENFKKMYEMMKKCCPGQSESADFSAMMKGMKEMCCGPATENNKVEAESRKE